MENWTVKSVDGAEVGAAPEVQETQAEAPTAQETEQAVVEEAIADTPNVEIVEDDVIKLDLSKPPQQEEKKEDEAPTEETPVAEEQPEAIVSEEAESPIEIITEEKAPEVKESEPVAIHEEPKVEEPKVVLPENVDKLVQFMEETGGTLEDYVNLNKDVSKLDDIDVIKEAYKQKYPHLNDEDIAFKMDDQFLFDEEVDEERTIRSKKLAFKEELYNARKFLNSNKEKYYADLVSSKQNNIPQEYQQAFETAQSYKQAEETNKQLQEKFTQATDQVFSQDFKGFDFKVGENTYRYKVADPKQTKEYQSDLNNFIGDYLGEDGALADAQGYHKALYAAKNVDKIAKHFYEQGRAEALKQSAKEAKNISMDPRSDFSASVVNKTGGKVRVVDNPSSGKFKFKNYNNR